MAQPSLDGKVALITGASRGMGRELAVAFIKAGARGVTVTAAAAADETPGAIDAELAETVALMEAAGGKGRALALQADICSPADCEAAVARTVAAFGGLHILMNHAGKSQRYHGDRDIPFWQTDPEGYRLVMLTNVVGTYNMARSAVPHMLKAGWGRIINTSKSIATMHEAYAGAYGPSKAAIEAEGLSWAEELAGSGVTVNSIQPGGPVPTKFGRGVIEGSRGLPLDVMVNCALWLASPLSEGVSGCRFDAKKWDPALPPAEAAERAREAGLFTKPASGRATKLDLAWRPPRQG